MTRTLLFSLLLISFQALGQEWLTLYQQSQTDYENNNLEEALENAKSALSLYESEYGKNNSNYCSILRHLSIISYSRGEINSAIQFEKNEIEILRNLEEVDKNILAGALNNLALFYQTTGESLESEPLLNEVIAIYRETGNSGDELQLALGMLAISQFAQGKMTEAGENFRASIGYFSNAENLPFDYLTILLNYGVYLVSMADYENAEQRLTEARNYYNQFELKQSPEYILLLRNLSRARDKAGSLEMAAADLENALEISKEIYGEDDQETSSIKSELALLYKKQGKTDLADNLSSGVDVNTLDVESKLDHAISQSNQGAISHAAGDFRGAEKLYLEAIQIFRETEKEINSYLNTLQNLGRLYQSIGEVEKAAAQLETARDLAKANYGENNHTFAEVLVNLANFQRALSNYQEAEPLYVSALSIFQSDPNSSQKEIARALEGLALHYLAMGKFDKSQENFLNAMGIYTETNDQEKLKNIKSNYAVLKQAMGEYTSAETILREIYSAAESEKKGTLAEAEAAEKLGSILLEVAKYQEAEQYFNTALKIREAGGKNTQEYANGLVNLARLRVREGKYTEAEPLYNESLKILKSFLHEDDIRIANLENNMALMYQYMGNLEKAEVLLRNSAEKIKKRLGSNHPEYATALENRASLLQAMGNREEALPLLLDALAIDEQTLGKTHPNYAFTLHNLASIYLAEQNYEKAEEFFRESLVIEKSVFGEEHPMYAGTLNNLGVLFEKQQNFKEAENYFKQALNVREKVLGEKHPDYAYSQYGLAVLYLKMGKLSEARNLYEAAIENYLDQVENFFPALSEKEKSDFYAKIKPIIENFKEFAIEYAVNEDRKFSSELIGTIYDVQLATKALLLNASNKVRNRITSSGDQELIHLFSQWVELKEGLARYYQYSLEQLAAENINITQLETEANQLEKEISLKSEDFAGEFDREAVSWRQIKDRLSESEAALEILRVQRNATTDTLMYIGLVIRKDIEFPRMVIIPYGESLELEIYKSYKNSIKFRVENPYAYNAFWGALAKELNGIGKVYLSSDGVYNKVNINTLQNPETEGYVIKDHEIILVSNTRELLKEPSSSQGKTAALMGFVEYQSQQPANPEPQGVFRALGSGGWLKNGVPMLEGTRKEIENISAMLGSQGWSYKSLETTNASESAIKNLNQTRLIHIATHGFFLEDLNIDESGDGFGAHVKNYEMNPLFRSGLLLAGSGETIFGLADENRKEDGILTAYEVMNLSLENTDLVVLSACETGLGEIRNGEGVYGLQRSLIVAGVNGLIMSLWKVNDETTQKLMTYFYQNWLSGKTKLEAFKEAQLTLKEEFTDPYYWGAFVLIGR